MALRLNGPKTRMALAMAPVIVAILLANAVHLILTGNRKLREDVERNGRLFAQLTNQPICVGYENFYVSARARFRELVRDLLRRAPDVEGWRSSTSTAACCSIRSRWRGPLRSPRRRSHGSYRTSGSKPSNAWS